MLASLRILWSPMQSYGSRMPWAKYCWIKGTCENRLDSTCGSAESPVGPGMRQPLAPDCPDFPTSSRIRAAGNPLARKDRFRVGWESCRQPSIGAAACQCAIGLMVVGSGLLLSVEPASGAANQPSPAAAVRASQPAAGQASIDPADNWSLRRASYTPGVLYLNVVKGRNGGQDFIDLALIPPSGALIGRRVMLSLNALRDQLRNLYSALARQQPMVVTDPSSASRQLYRLLIEPLSADFVHLGITTLILVPDVSLQAVPFSALHDGQQSFGERYAFSVTPSVSLMRQDFEPEAEGQKQLAFGASQFKGLAPLPLVPQEVERIAANGRGELFLNSSFTPDALINRVADPRVRRVHLATHAEFLPGGPSSSRLYTGSGSMDLSRFAALRQRRPGNPLDLFVLSACRTALGDPSSELGFAGLALQAGALSAIGTLWYVDDVATSAFFVQFYRFLDQGLPKAEALQATRRGFAKGLVRLQGDQVIGVDGRPLIDSLTPQQQRRVAEGLQHPFFWSGITLLGTPW